MDPSSSFKIVSTQERRGIYFTVVPHNWEKNNTLLWPEKLTHSQREILRSNAASVPGNGWAKYPCLVKCSNISTFKDALNLEKKLSDCIDTDAEEALFEETITKRKNKKTKYDDGHVLTDRNHMFADLDESQHTFSPINEAPIEVMNVDQAFQTIVLDPNGIMLEETTSATTDIANEIIHIKNEIRTLKEEFSSFKNEIKQQIKDDLSKINLCLDKIFRLFSNKDFPNKHIVDKPKKDLLENVRLPLETCEEISLLEEQIRNNMEFRTQLIELLSKIGGHSGEEDGLKVAYKVVDCVFKSDVLMQYSWTGVSRGASGEKKSFQMLDGILGVFFEVILLADNRHTKKKNCCIFKDGVLKHAKKRNARKRTRPTKSFDDTLPENMETDDIVLQDSNDAENGSDKEKIVNTTEEND